MRKCDERKCKKEIQEKKDEKECIHEMRGSGVRGRMNWKTGDGVERGGGFLGNGEDEWRKGGELSE